MNNSVNRAHFPYIRRFYETGVIKKQQAILDSYRDMTNVEKLLAVEVFDGGNDRAADILRFCGFEKLLSGINFAFLDDVAAFYGVEASYMKDALGRYGIGAKDLPEDVYTGQIYDFIVRFGEEAKHRYTVGLGKAPGVQPGTYLLYDKVLSKPVTVIGKYNRRMTYISARVALVLSCFLYYGRKIPADSMARTVFEKLRQTCYFEAALKKQQKNSQRHLDALEERRKARLGQNIEDTASKNEPNKSEGARITRDGDITLSNELFAKIVKIAVKEGVSEVLQNAKLVVEAPSKPAPQPKAYPAGLRMKLQKPANWEDVCARKARGEITLKEAAKEAGMCISSFSAYEKGKKQFQEIK